MVTAMFTQTSVAPDLIRGPAAFLSVAIRSGIQVKGGMTESGWTVQAHQLTFDTGHSYENFRRIYAVYRSALIDGSPESRPFAKRQAAWQQCAL